MRKQTLFKSDSVVFFDDNLDRNITPFREKFPKMKSIHVPSNKRYTQILKGRNDLFYPVMFSRKYKANRYANFVAKRLTLKHPETLITQSSNSTNQGLSIPKIQEVIRWAKTPSEKKRAVLFDLDQTLLPNNFLFDDNDMKQVSKGRFSLEEVAKYLAGTAERYDALKLMFSKLRSNGVACKIFTDNMWAYNGVRKEFLFFLRVMQIFDPQMTEADIIYGYKNKVTTFKRNKELMKIYRSV